MSIDIRI